MKATFDREVISYGRGLIAAGSEVDWPEKDLLPHLGGPNPRARLGWNLPPVGAVEATAGARALAEEHGLDLAGLEGSGKGGKVTKGDVEAALEGGDG